jgi:hypothetical protein
MVDDMNVTLASPVPSNVEPPKVIAQAKPAEPVLVAAPAKPAEKAGDSAVGKSDISPNVEATKQIPSKAEDKVVEKITHPKPVE